MTIVHARALNSTYMWYWENLVFVVVLVLECKDLYYFWMDSIFIFADDVIEKGIIEE